jgi:hypothetical protein
MIHALLSSTPAEAMMNATMTSRHNDVAATAPFLPLLTSYRSELRIQFAREP